MCPQDTTSFDRRSISFFICTDAKERGCANGTNALLTNIRPFTLVLHYKNHQEIRAKKTAKHTIYGSNTEKSRYVFIVPDVLTIMLGRIPGFFFKQSAKMIFVVKSQIRCDLDNFHIRIVLKIKFGLIDLLFDRITMYSCSKTGFEVYFCGSYANFKFTGDFSVGNVFVHS